MNSMTSMKVRIRTVLMNDRGQIVIPEEIRNDLHLKPKETLILVEKDGEITIRKESSVAETLMKENEFWGKIAEKSLENAWSKEDRVWEKIAAEDMK